MTLLRRLRVNQQRVYCTHACFTETRARGDDAAIPRYRWKAGMRADLGHAVRSRWEANVCRWLRHMGRAYEYEPATFRIAWPDGTARLYTPDLRVAGTDVFIEVKGWWVPAAREKLALFWEQYPCLRLVVIDRSFYRGLSRHYSCGIPGWEPDNW